jgi:DNA-binding FadR family transcriptional regulator
MLARILRRRGELEEVLVYRRVLEPQVARHAAGTRRKADLAAISSAIESMTSATTDPDYMRYDTAFHLAIARATRNRFLVSAIEDMRLRLNDVVSLLPESDVWHRRLSSEHEEIARAIETREETSAEAAMAQHVAASEQGVRAVLTAIRRRLAS